MINAEARAVQRRKANAIRIIIIPIMLCNRIYIAAARNSRVGTFETVVKLCAFVDGVRRRDASGKPKGVPFAPGAVKTNWKSQSLVKTITKSQSFHSVKTRNCFITRIT